MYSFYKEKDSLTVLLPLTGLNHIKKESIVSLLLLLAGCDQDLTEGLTIQELEYIDFHTHMFKLEDEFTLLDMQGVDGVIGNLKSLSLDAKRSLVIVFYGLLVYNSQASEFEIERTCSLLNDLGISETETIKILINKTN